MRVSPQNAKYVQWQQSSRATTAKRPRLSSWIFRGVKSDGRTQTDAHDTEICKQRQIITSARRKQHQQQQSIPPFRSQIQGPGEEQDTTHKFGRFWHYEWQMSLPTGKFSSAKA